MKLVIEEAIKRGINIMAFTDHIDLDFDLESEEPDWIFDRDLYFETIDRYRSIYKNQIKLYRGVEIGVQPHLKERNLEVVEAHPYDFVIGSLHSVDGRDLYNKVLFKEYSLEEAVKRYYMQYYESIQNYNAFDVLGHLDLILRYEPRCQGVNEKIYWEILEAMLKDAIGKGKGIELNAGGYRYGLNQSNPAIAILNLYKHLGGEIVTIGSDAHTPDYLGTHFKDNLELLESVGLKYYCTFKARKPIFHKL
jgi:histidinol-phosphatase (PHP family)